VASREEYADWAKRFMTGLGLKWDDQRATVQEWFDLLARFSAEQLDAARLSMLRSRERHPDMQAVRVALLKALRDLDAVEPMRSVVESTDHGVCAWCSDTGFVRVPHPASIVAGQWRPVKISSFSGYYRATVACTCHMGRKVWQGCENAVQDGSKRAKKLMRLDDYEKHVCRNWREELAERKRIEDEEKRLVRIDESRPREKLRLKIASVE
jgi:hypothetical protein